MITPYCAMTRLHVVARALDEEFRDGNGRSLFCLLNYARAYDGQETVVGGWSGASETDAPGKFEHWSDPGSFVVRAGAALYLAGGVGRFEVQIDKALEVWARPEELWVTSYLIELAPVAAPPPRATLFRALDGDAEAGGVPLVVGRTYPLAALGPIATIQARGRYQFGSIV